MPLGGRVSRKPSEEDTVVNEIWKNEQTFSKERNMHESF